MGVEGAAICSSTPTLGLTRALQSAHVGSVNFGVERQILL
jgi:hypothetical protein